LQSGPGSFRTERSLVKKNYSAQIPTDAWASQKKFMLAISRTKTGLWSWRTPLGRWMARGALRPDALNNRTIHLIGPVASRALLRVGSRPSFEIDPSVSSIAVRTGFSLFEKFRSAVRKPRS
jgi:hypothetical protein